MPSNKYFPSLSIENHPDAPSIVTPDRVVYVDHQSNIRMVGFVGETILGSAEYQAHTVPAAVVAQHRIEPGAPDPPGPPEEPGHLGLRP